MVAVSELPQLADEILTQVLCGDAVEYDLHPISEFVAQPSSIELLDDFLKVICESELHESLRDDIIKLYHDHGRWNVLLVLLHSFLENSGAPAFVAGSVYFRILEISLAAGHLASVFHPVFFRKVMNTLLLPARGIPGDEAADEGPSPPYKMTPMVVCWFSAVAGIASM